MPVTVPVLDNFTRANSADLGADWDVQPLNDTAIGCSIVSNQVGGSSSYAYDWYAAATYSTASGTVEAAVLVPALPGNTFAWWIGLLQQPSNSASTCDGYECSMTTQVTGLKQAIVGRYDNAVYTEIAASLATLVFNAGDTFIVRNNAAGNIRLIRDAAGVETELLAVTSTTYTGAFSIGIGIFDTANTTRLDDFAAGVLAGARPGLVMAPRPTEARR